MSANPQRLAKIISKARTQALVSELNEFLKDEASAAVSSCNGWDSEDSFSENSLDNSEDSSPSPPKKQLKKMAKAQPKISVLRRKLNLGRKSNNSCSKENDVPSGSKHVPPIPQKKCPLKSVENSSLTPVEIQDSQVVRNLNDKIKTVLNAPNKLNGGIIDDGDGDSGCGMSSVAGSEESVNSAATGSLEVTLSKESQSIKNLNAKLKIVLNAPNKLNDGNIDNGDGDGGFGMSSVADSEKSVSFAPNEWLQGSSSPFKSSDGIVDQIKKPDLSDNVKSLQESLADKKKTVMTLLKKAGSCNSDRTMPSCSSSEDGSTGIPNSKSNLDTTTSVNSTLEKIISSKNSNETTPSKQRGEASCTTPVIGGLADNTDGQNSSQSSCVGANFSSLASSFTTSTPIPQKANPTGSKRQALSNTNVDDVFSEVNCLNGEWIKNILKKSVQGKLVLMYYAENSCLISRKRSVIAQVVIDNEILDDEYKLISPQRFFHLAQAICMCFPTEITDTYYVPRYIDRFKKVHKAKGKLYDRWINLRRDFSTDDLKPAKEACVLDEIDLLIEGAVLDDETKKNIAKQLTWCENKSTPLRETILAFKDTCLTRLEQFRSVEPKVILSYFSKYPALAKENGFILIDNDFDIVYPEKGLCLQRKWLYQFARKIIAFGLKSIRRRKDLLLNCKSLKIDLAREDEQSLIVNSFYLLPLLLSSVTVKKGFKPSNLEAKDGFLVYAETIEEASEILDRRNARLAQHNIPEQPTAVVIGPPSKQEYLVVLGDIIYKCDTAIAAIDICFKIFILLKVPVAPDSPFSWLFLKFYVYEIEREHARDYPSIQTVKNDMGL